MSRTPNTVLGLAFGCLMALGCGTDDRTANWGTISPSIMQPTCATVACHSRASAVVGLDFSTRERGYQSLTALKSFMGARLGPVARPLVSPGDPDHSHLVRILRADGVRRMPPDRPLPDGDIQLIEDWILNGALND